MNAPAFSNPSLIQQPIVSGPYLERQQAEPADGDGGSWSSYVCDTPTPLCLPKRERATVDAEQAQPSSSTPWDGLTQDWNDEAAKGPGLLALPIAWSDAEAQDNIRTLWGQYPSRETWREVFAALRKSRLLLEECQCRTLFALIKPRPGNSYPTFFEGLLPEMGSPLAQDKAREGSGGPSMPLLVVQDMIVTDWAVLPVLRSMADPTQAREYCAGLKANAPKEWQRWYLRARLAIERGTDEGYALNTIATVILDPSRCDWARAGNGLLKPIIQEAINDVTGLAPSEQGRASV